MNDADNSYPGVVQGGLLDEQRIITERLSAGVSRPEVLLWQYDTPAIILGCSQRPDEAQLQRAGRAGLPIMRRGSGGGAVMAGPWMLSVTLFIPLAHSVGALNIIEIFSWLEKIWTRALNDCGVDCKGVDKTLIDQSKQIAKQQEVQWACYASLSHGEVVSTDGRKLVGLAQIRKLKGIALVSGLHLYPCDWPVLCDVVANDPSKAAVLDALNTDAEQLSGMSASQLIPQIIHHLMLGLPDDFDQMKPGRAAAGQGG